MLVASVETHNKRKQKWIHSFKISFCVCNVYKIRIYFVPGGIFYLDSESNLTLCAFCLIPQGSEKRRKQTKEHAMENVDTFQQNNLIWR